MSRSYPGIAVSTKPRLVGVSRWTRATRVRSTSSTEIFMAAPPSRLVSRVVQHAARIAPRVRALLQQHLAVHHGVVDPLGQLADPPAVAREIVDDVFFAGPHGVGVEDDEVGGHPRLEQPAVVDPEGRGRIEGEAPDGVLE